MRDLSHHHWGMTSRNAKERNGGSRNDEALESFVSLLEGVRTSSLFAQTCGHRNGHYSPGREEVLFGACPLGLPDCRMASALFLGHTGEIPRHAANTMVRIAKRLRVPAFLVTHADRDESLTHDVSVAAIRSGVKETTEGTWHDFTSLLRSAQFEHESRSDHPECRSSDEDWLKVGVGKGLRADLSLSNAIREIPGVRHTDIDSVLTCIECSQPVVYIESSSDGITPREDAIKAATVTRDIGRRSKVTTFLIQHQVGDALLSAPVAVTKWMVTGSVSDRYDHEMMEWEEARTAVQNAIDDHWERFCD